ncbi:hypothetical protein [Peptostreptococcus sp. D1]|nr:hypothetical protein [Peptostreptococcus sp. D1]
MLIYSVVCISSLILTTVVTSYGNVLSTENTEYNMLENKDQIRIEAEKI